MGWMALWWLVGIALVVLLVWAVVLRGPYGFGQGGAGSPEEILKRRYAKGEIDRETYERIREDLKK